MKMVLLKESISWHMQIFCTATALVRSVVIDCYRFGVTSIICSFGAFQEKKIMHSSV
jgi:hypothetical protein